jgi:Zn-finger nucleic acid-binding protein
MVSARCPKCSSQVLVPFEKTAALRCAECQGFWVPPAALEEPDVRSLLRERDLHPKERLEQDHRTGPCPDGHGLLRRARVTNDDPYFVERCARCGGVWFDPGEWTRLADTELLGDVTNLWSPAWREHLSEEQNRASLANDLRQKLGTETFELLEHLIEKLTEQDAAALALAYLRERLRER